MAIYFAGYLSPIRNKLGNAVGRKWRTLDVLAVYNGRPRNPRTDAQQTNRIHFGVAATLARAFASASMLGFKPICDGTPIPQRSMFIRKNWDCVSVSDPNSGASVDYDDIVLAEGALPEAGFGSASFSNPLSVEVPLTDNSSIPGADANDKVYIFVYSPEAQAGLLGDEKVRADASVACTVPANWVGHRVHVWGFAVGNGNENKGRVSNSLYIGTGTIA